VVDGELERRVCVALIGRLPEEPHRLGIVLSHAVAVREAGCHEEERFRIALLGLLLEEAHGVGGGRGDISLDVHHPRLLLLCRLS